MSQECQFLKNMGGVLSKKYVCTALGTTVPDIRIQKCCKGDFFSCDIFRNKLEKNER